ncbi:MAG: hypothetical protein ABSA11_07455 [Candidatus Bathyarchaeia archaeon]|jgi:integrase
MRTTEERETENRKVVYDLMISKQVKENNSKKIAKAVNLYCLYRNTTPESLLSEAKADFDKTQKELVNYYEQLKTEVLESTAKERVYSKITSFYTHSGFRFPLHFTPKINKLSQAIQADRDHEFLKLNKEESETFIDKTELRKFLNSLSPRDRSIGLAMLSSSQDSGDIFRLTVGQFKTGCKMNGTGIRFFWDNNRVKTSERFQSFFSVEATEAVNQYLETERIGALETEPLFTINATIIDKKTKKKITKIVAMQPEHLHKAYSYTAKQIGIVWDSAKFQNPFRPKRLRHYFLTCASKAGIDEIFQNILTGHTLTIGQSYVENRADLEIIYKRIEPYLTIFGNVEQLTKAVKTIADVEDIVKQQNDLIRDLKIDRLETKADLEEMKKKNTALDQTVSIMKDEFEKAYAEFREERDRMRKANELKDQKEAPQ